MKDELDLLLDEETEPKNIGDNGSYLHPVEAEEDLKLLNLDWEDLEETESNYSEFPIETLPIPVKNIIKEIQKVLKTDINLAASIALGYLGVALGDKLIVSPKPDHLIPCNLWISLFSTVGSGKTPLYRILGASVNRANKQLQQQNLEDLTKYKIESKLHADKIKQNTTRRNKLLNQTKELSKEQENELEKLNDEYFSLVEAAPKQPKAKKLIVGDITPEALIKVLINNDEYVSFVDSEARKVWEIVKGRYSAGIPQVDFFLKGHTGDSHHVDRVSGDSMTLNNPLISFLIAAQPDMVKDIGNVETITDSGFLARFLFYANPKPIKSEYTRDTIDGKIKIEYDSFLESLLGFCQDCKVEFILDSKAFKTFSDYKNSIKHEPIIAPSDKFRQDWQSKQADTVCRIAAILCFCENHEKGKIPEGTEDFKLKDMYIKQAIKIVDFYRSNLQTTINLLYNVSKDFSENSFSVYLNKHQDKLTSYNGNYVVTPRDLVRYKVDGLSNTKAADNYLREYANLGYLQCVYYRKSEKGKTKKLYFVHPDLMGEK